MTINKKSNQSLERLSIKAFHTAPKLPVSLVLDNVRSMQNVGSFFRTADAFLIEALYLCGITPTPPHRDIQKTALGATDTVVWHKSHTLETLRYLRSQGYCILAIEQTTQSLWLHEYTFEANMRYAFVFGNEMNGVSQEALDFVDACIELPQFGTKHSLNVSVCVGVCLWEYARQVKFFT